MWLLEHGAVSALTPAPRTRRAILASAGGSRAPRAPPAPSQRAQRARAEARQRASRGSGAPHGPPRCRATPARVRVTRFLDLTYKPTLDRLHWHPKTACLRSASRPLPSPTPEPYLGLPLASNDRLPKPHPKLI